MMPHRPRSVAATLLALVLGLSAAACGPTLNSDPDAAARPAPNGVGVCCRADPAPNCCMNYGGWSATAQGCGTACDGMPLPSDPGWHLAADDHGCQRWIEPPRDGRPFCGEPVRDAGVDGGPTDGATR